MMKTKILFACRLIALLSLTAFEILTNAPGTGLAVAQDAEIGPSPKQYCSDKAHRLKGEKKADCIIRVNREQLEAAERAERQAAIQAQERQKEWQAYLDEYKKNQEQLAKNQAVIAQAENANCAAHPLWVGKEFDIRCAYWIHKGEKESETDWGNGGSEFVFSSDDGSRMVIYFVDDNNVITNIASHQN